MVENCRSLLTNLTDLFDQKFGITYQNTLTFEDETYLDIIKGKCQKMLGKNDVQAENNWFLALYEEEFRKKMAPKIEVRWINHRLGYGIFAIETIPSMTYVGEYAGLVRKRKGRRDRFNDYAFGYTIARKNTKFMIDAKEQGNLMRFVNHSDEPNTTSHWLIVDNLCHMAFFTNKAITAGHQLTYDYGPYYWRSRSDPKLI